MTKPRDLADRMRRQRHEKHDGAHHDGYRRDGYRRETFALPRDAARAKAREVLDRYPNAAYGTKVEAWRELPDGRIEFTMRRLPTAD